MGLSNIALVLLSTKREYDTGLMHQCLDMYLNSMSKHDTIDIIISVNSQFKHDLNQRYRDNHHVNTITIHNCDIPAEQDVYIQSDDQPDPPYEFGNSNGPNKLFYETFKMLEYKKSYLYFMVIETDSRPVGEFWLDRLQRFCNHNSFIIAGSTYKGSMTLPDTDWIDHLNGIALYSNRFATYDIIHGSMDMLTHTIHIKKHARLNYDIAIWYYVNSAEGAKYLSQAIDTNIIANYSLPCDTGISEKDILAKHPHTIILHQKI